MVTLPPLDCLRFFEVAARYQSFVRAADELNVTPAAVAYRVKVLEDSLGFTLFDRTHKGVALNSRGTACWGDVQRVLADIQTLIEHHRVAPPTRRLNIIAVECVAVRWLMSKLPSFNLSHPDIIIALETDHLATTPKQHDFDIWIAFDGEANAPHLEATVRELLFEDTMFPVCSPTLLKARGHPRAASELQQWPLLYHLGWPNDWTYWFAAQGAPPPDLSHASGFRLCSMLTSAVVEGMGVAIGRPTAVESELRQGTLVPVFERSNEAHTRCIMMTTAQSRRKPEVQVFREWILQMAAAERRDGVSSPS